MLAAIEAKLKGIHSGLYVTKKYLVIVVTRKGPIMSGMVGLAPKWVRLAPKWDKSGAFSDQISVWF